MTSKYSAAAAACVLLGFAMPAAAATTVFTIRSTFNAAAGSGLATESFEASQPTGPTLTYSGFSVSETNGSNLIASSSTQSSSPAALSDGSYYINYDDNGDSLLVFRFSKAINAFGLDIAFDEAQTASFSVGGNTIGLRTLAANTRGFFGAISDTSFTQFTIDVSRGPVVGIDQLSFGKASPSAVPEPATWAMMILGFGFIGWSIRRVKKLATVNVA